MAKPKLSKPASPTPEKTASEFPVQPGEDVSIRSYVDELTEAYDLALGLSDLLCSASGDEGYAEQAFFVMWIAAQKLVADLEPVNAVFERKGGAR